MSTLVDERIVELGFDNKNFEKNVKTSLGTIESLKSSLNFSGTANQLNKSLESVDVSSLSNNLSKATQGFTTMEIAAIAAIANISNRLVDLGITLVKSLSIDNVAAGWVQYADKTIAVGTLTATGKYTDELISDTIDKLEWFADETSYTINDMMSALTAFTSAGMGLEQSEQAIMGIATWAAKSGKDAAVASRAFDIMSKALSRGNMDLRQWQSLELAGMATEEFKQKIVDLASSPEFGMLQKTLDGKYVTDKGSIFGMEDFSKYLSEGWMNKDIMSKVLGDYSSAVDGIYDAVLNDDDIDTASDAIEKLKDTLDPFGKSAFEAAQEARTFKDVIDSVKSAVSSGWSKTFENIFGGYKEAKMLWTDLANELYDVFMGKLNFRNDILGMWGELGGRSDLFANTEDETGAFWNLYYAVIALKNLITDSWNTIFPWSAMEKQSDQITDIAGKLKIFTARLKDMSESLKMSEQSSKSLSGIFKGLFSLVKIFTNIVGVLWNGFKPLLVLVKDLASLIIYVLGEVGERFSNLIMNTQIFTKVGNKLNKTMNSLVKSIKGLFTFDKIKMIMNSVTESFKKGMGGSKGFEGAIISLKTITDALSKSFDWLVNILLKYVIPTFGTVIKLILETMGYVAGLIVRSIRWIIDSIKYLYQLVKGNETLLKVGNNVVNFFKSIPSKLTPVLKFFQRIFETIKDGLIWTFEFVKSIPSRTGILGTVYNFLKNIILGTIDLIIKLGKTMGEFFKSISMSSFGDFMTSLGAAFMKLLRTISNTLIGFKKVDTDPVEDFTDDMEKKLNPLQAVVKGMTKLFQGLWDLLSAILPAIGKAIGLIGDLLSWFADKIRSVFGDKENEWFTLKNILNVTFWTALAAALWSFFKAYRDIKEALLSIVGGFGDVLDSQAMMNYAQALKTLAVAVLILVAAFVLLAMIDESKILGASIALAAITASMVTLMKVLMMMFETTDKWGIKALASSMSMKWAAEAMKAFAISIVILAGTMFLLARIEKDEMIRGITGIVVLFGLMIFAAKMINSNSGQLKKAAKGIMPMAAAIWAMTKSVQKLGKLETTALTKGLLAVTSLVTMATIFAAVARTVKQGEKSANSLAKFSTSLMIASIPLMIIGNLDWTKFARGISGIASIMVLLVVLDRSSKTISSSEKAANNLAKVSRGLLIASASFMFLGLMPWPNIAKGAIALLAIIMNLRVLNKFLENYKSDSLNKLGMGLASLSIGLIVFAVAMRALNSVKWTSMLKAGVAIVSLLQAFKIFTDMDYDLTKTMMQFSKSMILLSLGIMVFSVAMRMMEKIDLTTMLLSIGGVVLLLGALSLVAKFADTSSSNMVVLATSLISLGIGMVTLSMGLKAMGSLDLITIAMGLGVVVGTMLLLAGLSMALMKITPVMAVIAKTMLIFAVSIAVLAVAMTLLAATLVPFSVALSASLLSILGTIAASSLALTAALTALVTAVIKTLINVMDGIFVLIKIIIINILQSLMELGPEIIHTILYLIMNLLEQLTMLIPALTNLLYQLIISLLDVVSSNIGELASKVVNIILGAMDALIENLPILIAKAGELARTFITEIVDEIVIMTPFLVEKLFDLVLGMVEGLGQAIEDNAERVREAMVNFAKHMWNAFKNFWGINSPSTKMAEIGQFLWDGLKKGLQDGLEAIKTFIKSIAGKVLDFFSEKWNDAKETGKAIINNVKNGIDTAWNSTKNFFTSAGDKILSAVKTGTEKAKQVGEDISTGIKGGLEKGWDAVTSTAKNLGNGLVNGFKNIFGIKSPSRVFAEFGKFIDMGLAQGIDVNSKMVYNASNEMGEDVIDGVEDSGINGALKKMFDQLNMDFDGDIVIRPVLDLTEIQNGAEMVRSMLNGGDYALAGSNGNARSAYNSMKNTTKRANSASEGIGENVSNNTITNNFNIQGTNAKDIADEVSKKIQEQVERKQGRWAR